MIHAYAAMESKGKLEAFEYDPGPLAGDQVEIQVEHCGICHSDLSMLNNEWGMSQYPLVPGHEVVGKVSAVGDRVTDLKVGQQVGLGWHSGYCLSCHSCHQGDHNLCSQAQGTIVGHHGGFANKVRAQSTSVVPIPEGMDAQAVAPLFCAGVTVFSPLLQFDVKPTHRVGVIGIGGLGHLALQFLKAWGCEVWAFTTSEAKRKEALELGAHYTADSRDPDQLKSLGSQFDLILSTVNAKLDWNVYVNALAPRGRLHFVGATLDPLDLSVFSMMAGQRSVSSSPVGSPVALDQMLKFAHRHNIKAKTEVFPFDKVNEAMAHLESGKAHYRVVLSHSA